MIYIVCILHTWKYITSGDPDKHWLAYVIKMVTDALAPTRHQVINDNHGDSAMITMSHELCISISHYSHYNMMTSSNGNIFRITGHVCGEFTGPRWIPRTQRPVMRSFDVFFDLRLNKRLSKQGPFPQGDNALCIPTQHCNLIALPRIPQLSVGNLYICTQVNAR